MYTLHKTMGKVSQIVGYFLTVTRLFREIRAAFGDILCRRAQQLDNCKICNIIDIMVLSAAQVAKNEMGEQEMKKRILAAALAVSMLFGSASMLPKGTVGQWLSLGAHAQTIVKSGTCGENVTWTLDSDGTVTISGSGDMKDYADNYPYRSPFRDDLDVKKVIIEDGVTRIGERTFLDNQTIEEIISADSIESIGEYAFTGSSWLDKKREEEPVVILSNIVISYGTCEDDLVIPDGVKRIAHWAFHYSTINDLYIPDSVEVIENDAVCECNVKNVYIGNGTVKIGNRAFRGCPQLKSVSIGSKVKEIGAYAFGDCDSLTEIKVSSENPYFCSIDGVLYNKAVTDIKAFPSGKDSIDIPDTVDKIGDSAFSGCNKLKKATIPGSVTSIGNSAFCECTSLESVVIPDSVEKIGEAAFNSCKALKEITIPDGITQIPDSAFSICSSLESIELPQSLTYIDSQAFDNCESLKSITLPQAVEEIAEQAFFGCESLESIVFNGNIKNIDDGAFMHCNSLKSVTIPKSVETMGVAVFGHCDNLTEINFDSENLNYSSADGVVYNKDGTELVLFPAGRESFDIPETVTALHTGAFESCEKLKSVSIPSSLTTIPICAFDGCEMLENVNIHEGIVSIGNNAFSDCDCLKSIKLPDSAVSIGDNAFSDCDNLTEVKLPRGLTKIGTQAFWSSDKLSDIKLPENLKTIKQKAFEYCISLNEITIPESVNTIERYAFSSCPELKTATIPESVAVIEEYAFGLTDDNTKTPDFKIRCYKFSAAEKYAKKYGFDIEYLINEKDRFAGDDRYSTAAAISGGSFSRANTVVIASGLDHADALAGVPLAAAFSAPILLTKKTSLPQATLDEIKRLKAKNVIILGGEGAVGANVEQTLKNNGLSVERIAGKTRFETAVKIAQRVEQKTGSKPSGVFFVNAFGYADALSASSAAAASGSVIIYLRSDGTLDSATEEYLKGISGADVNAYVIGGEGVVSDEIAKLAGTALGADSIRRIAGENRYKTCAQVNKQFADVLSGKAVCVAKGLDFPDALAGGVFAAMTRSPILLADGSVDDTYGELLGGRDLWKIYVFGGKSAVPDELLKSLYKYLD